MAFSPEAIANFFIDLAKEQGKPLSPMKLQKLVYFAHGWSLAIKDKPLINEQVEAWKFGPVIRSLYHKLKGYGNQPITERVQKRIPNGFAAPREVTPTIETESDDPECLADTRALLNRIWEVYSTYSANQLSNMTHTQDGPWEKVFRQWNGDPPKGTDIPQSEIRDYFAAKSST